MHKDKKHEDSYDNAGRTRLFPRTIRTNPIKAADQPNQSVTTPKGSSSVRRLRLYLSSTSTTYPTYLPTYLPTYTPNLTTTLPNTKKFIEYLDLFHWFGSRPAAVDELDWNREVNYAIHLVWLVQECWFRW